jgi:hypothetical protein
MTHLLADFCNLECLKPNQAGDARYPTSALPHLHDLRRLVFDEGAARVGWADAGGVAVPLRVDLFADGRHQVPGVGCAPETLAGLLKNTNLRQQLALRNPGKAQIVSL